MVLDLDTRLESLTSLGNAGKTIVGYVPNGYLPDELVWACDAVPIALFCGGEASPVILSGRCLLRFLDTFCRAQIGYRLSGVAPIYQVIDVLIVPVTDNHVRAIADSWDFYTNVEVLRFGVPHAKTDHGFSYYLDGLHSVKERLEAMTGIEITTERLKKEIALSNRIKALLRNICLTRKSDTPPISGREFIELEHACLYSDRYTVLETLESTVEALTARKATNVDRPRILLTGSTLALGDYKVHALVEEAGASIVIEEFSEGTKDYWHDVETDGEPMQALAESYFIKRLPGAFFRGAADERFPFLIDLIEKFRVDGVIWYSLMYRDSYDVEGYLFGKILDRMNLPWLKISSDYDESEIDGLRTKIETFVEMITQGA
jgi:benzoyl-CoA reductase/2-hydroxyglutaryl-CoA dehydratase subunit BcrC/BadD/HgdB